MARLECGKLRVPAQESRHLNVRCNAVDVRCGAGAMHVRSVAGHQEPHLPTLCAQHSDGFYALEYAFLAHHAGHEQKLKSG